MLINQVFFKIILNVASYSQKSKPDLHNQIPPKHRQYADKYLGSYICISSAQNMLLVIDET